MAEPAPVSAAALLPHVSLPAAGPPAAGTAVSSAASPSWFLNRDPHFLPAWARSHVKYAQNLLESSSEPIEYDHDEIDYRDNCFFFPEDCVYHPPPPQPGQPSLLGDWASIPDATEADSDLESSIDKMGPSMLSGIRMLDTAALTDLLEDNLSPPEITSIFIFATNGAIFAHASPLPQRQVRSLCATYGTAYVSYAVSHSNGNLTGVNPATNPSSFVTAPSIPLRDVSSIIFELDDHVAVVTKIAEKVLLATVGPARTDNNPKSPLSNGNHRIPTLTSSTASDVEHALRPVDFFPTAQEQLRSSTLEQAAKLASSAPAQAGIIPVFARVSGTNTTNEAADESLRAQWEIDRTSDLDRLSSLNLNSPPTILLALESKSAALGRFLSNKLADLESPEDF